MIRRLNRTIRLFAAVLAAMQFAMPAVVSVADGFVAHESRSTQTRPDGANASTQNPGHPVDCVLCWYLSATLAQADNSAPPPPAMVQAPVVEVPVARGVAAPRWIHHSRAPPTPLG